MVIETYHPKNAEEVNRKLCEDIKENVSTALDVTLKKVILIHPRSIPKTISGKIQRNLAKKQYENQELRSVYIYE